MQRVIGIGLALFITVTGLFAVSQVEHSGDSMNVIYEVKCKSCDVSFKNGDGTTEEVMQVRGKWTYSFNGIEGQFAYISATNPDGRDVTVTIKRGGKIVIVGTSDIADKTARAGIIL